MTYYPRKPVTSFQDLEVYQRLLAIAVVIIKHVPMDTNIALVDDLHEQVLILPVSIGEAHSLRFGDTPRALKILEEIMVGCNKTIAYLELYRDLYSAVPDVDPSVVEGRLNDTAEFYDEQIKNIVATRFKVLHLQRSWVKFTPSGIKTDTQFVKTK